MAICDEDVLGETFRDGDIVLDVKEEFYCKEKIKEDTLKSFFDRATIINAVGQETIELLIDEELVDSDNVLEVEHVPHAQVVRIE